MVFFKKDVLTNFAKFTRIHLRESLVFNYVFNRFTEFNFIKKEILEQMFSCEFWKISRNTLYKEPFGRLLLPKDSFCLLSHHDLLPFQRRCQTYILTEYFLSLSCRLETRASSIFQTPSQKAEPYFQPSETSAIELFLRK